MSRRLIRPFFSFWDPFFTEPFFPTTTVVRLTRPQRPVVEVQERSNDALETFENFFKQHVESSNLRPEQKEFFQKHYPEKVSKAFNPYEVLGLEDNADLDKVKEAYRTSALKYHPKNNDSEEAKAKFEQISKAYNEIVNQKQTDDNGEDVSTKSLFQDFNERIEAITKANKQQSQDKEAKNDKVEEKESKNKEDLLKGAELYSESSYFEYVNGKKKIHITKMYEKDGKTLKVDRVEETKPDGSVEVT